MVTYTASTLASTKVAHTASTLASTKVAHIASTLASTKVAHTASTLASTMVAHTAYTLAISVLAGAIGLTEGVRSVPGMAIVPDHVVSSWTVTARVQCYTLCLYSPYCVSVNWRWKADPAVCDLNKVTESHFPTAVRSDHGSVYIELSAEEVSGRMCRCQPSEICAPIGHQGYLCLRSGFSEDTTPGGGSVPTTVREEDEPPAPPVPTTVREEDEPPAPPVPTTAREEDETPAPPVPTTAREEDETPAPPVPTTTREEDETPAPPVPTTATQEDETAVPPVPTTPREKDKTAGPACTSSFTYYEHYHLKENNRRKMAVDTVEQCLQACVNEREFVCRSVDIWERRTKMECQLSDVTKDDKPSKWTNSHAGASYYQRTCDL